MKRSVQVYQKISITVKLNYFTHFAVICQQYNPMIDIVLLVWTRKLLRYDCSFTLFLSVNFNSRL